MLKVIVLGHSVEAFLPQIVATVTDSITRTKGSSSAAGGGGGGMGGANGVRRGG